MAKPWGNAGVSPQKLRKNPNCIAYSAIYKASLPFKCLSAAILTTNV
jgi:hypothetical protein